MFSKYFILKSQSFTLFKKVNSDNNNPSLSESNNENNDNNKEDYSNNDNNSNNKKHNYVKVLVDDPFNNRDIILNVTKKQKGVDVKHPSAKSILAEFKDDPKKM